MNTTKKTYTTDELIRVIPLTFTEKDLHNTQAMYHEDMTYNKAIELIEAIIDQTEKPEDWSKMDCLAFLVKNAYLAGAIQATRMTVMQNIHGFLELAGEEPSLERIEAIASGEEAL